MSETLIAVAVLPLLFSLVVLVECSRLYFARLLQRRPVRLGPARSCDTGRAGHPSSFR